MVHQDDGEIPQARPPSISDLVSLCRHLNEAGARYVVIGGMAVIRVGFVRATEDIDLLIDASPDNIERVRQGLMSLPDRAVQDLALDDVERYVVVRVADEIVVDLMKAACGVTYEQARASVAPSDLHGVVIPFASAELLWRTKQTMREKDRLDRVFLAQLLGKRPG